VSNFEVPWCSGIMKRRVPLPSSKLGSCCGGGPKMTLDVWSLACGDRDVCEKGGELIWPNYTRWFKYDRDCLCVNLATSVLVIIEPPCTLENLLYWGKTEIA